MSAKEGTYLSDMRKRDPLSSGWFSEVLASGLIFAADTASCVKSAILNLPVGSLGSGNTPWEHWSSSSCWQCHHSVIIAYTCISLCPVFPPAPCLEVHPRFLLWRNLTSHNRNSDPIASLQALRVQMICKLKEVHWKQTSELPSAWCITLPSLLCFGCTQICYRAAGKVASTQ